MLTDAIDSIGKKVKKGKGISKDMIKERNGKVWMVWGGWLGGEDDWEGTQSVGL